MAKDLFDPDGSFELLLEVREIAESLGIKLFLWAGTLLGALREGRVIPDDDDVDVAFDANQHDSQVLADLLQVEFKHAWYTPIHMLNDGKTKLIRLMQVFLKTEKGYAQVDILPLYRDPRGWWLLKNRAKKRPYIFWGYKFSSSLLDPPAEDTAMLGGEEFYIPNQAMQLVSSYYKDWHIPCGDPKKGKAKIGRSYFGPNLPKRR